MGWEILIPIMCVWGRVKTFLLEAEEDSGCYYLNDGSPIRLICSKSSKSAVDLLIVPSDVITKADWIVLDDTFSSDYFSILIDWFCTDENIWQIPNYGSQLQKNC